MKITYIPEDCVYRVDLENQEMEIWLNTTDITEAREYFINHMKWLFDESVHERLKE